MTRATTSQTDRLTAVFDLAIVLIFALFLWAPWDRTASAVSTSSSMAWLALPVMLARHGVHLELATMSVTISAFVFAALGALLSIAARLRGSTALWAAGAFLFGAAVAILMPLWTAVGFLGALLLILALRARFAALRPVTSLAAVLSELWPLGYAAGFAALAWRYNPQLLLKTLVIAFGLSLVARALVPAPRAAASAH
jgi:hypothetical protein